MQPLVAEHTMSAYVDCARTEVLETRAHIPHSNVDVMLEHCHLLLQRLLLSVILEVAAVANILVGDRLAKSSGRAMSEGR